MAIDLANDWLRKEIATPSVYYGYSTQPGALDTDSVWAVRKVTTAGGVDTVTWNDNIILNYNAKWSERVALFSTLSGSLGVTWSVTSGSDSFNNSFSNVSISWTDLSGSNLYRLSVIDHLGVLYNYLHQPFQNVYITNPITTEQTSTSYNFRSNNSMTYSVTVTAVNSAGSSASTVTIKT